MKQYIDNDSDLDPYGQMMVDDLESGTDDELYLAPASQRYEFDQDDDDNSNIAIVDVDDDFDSDYEGSVAAETIPMVAQSRPTTSKNIPNDDEYAKQLEVGVLVEFEHLHWWSEDASIDDAALGDIARMIADDHLKVTPDYYTKLIRAGLVDEQDAIDLHDAMYGKETIPKKSTPPLPKSPPANRPKATAYQSDFKMTLEPTTSTAKIQPERVAENKKKPIDEADRSYESLLTDNTDYTNENLDISTAGVSLDDGIDFTDVEVW